MFYFFAFFLFFVNGVVDLFNYSRLFTPYTVYILGQGYKIITPNFDDFINNYTAVANGTVAALNETLGCRLDNKGYYYDFVRSESPHWNIYLILGILTMRNPYFYIHSNNPDPKRDPTVPLLDHKNRLPLLRHNNLRGKLIPFRPLILCVLPAVVCLLSVWVLLYVELCVS